MDYEELLKKYMQHVKDCESITFVNQIGDYCSEVEFTEEEREALEQIDDGLRS